MSYSDDPVREPAFARPPSFPVLADIPGIDDYPPSCNAVLMAVVTNGPLTVRQLRQCTGLSKRTVRYAVRRLTDGGDDNPDHALVDTRPSMQDARTRTVSLGSDIEVPTDYKDKEAWP